MTSSRAAGRRSRALLCAVAAAGLAAMLGGCNTTGEDLAADYPRDYRVRHPIVVHEGVRTVEVFVSRNRGGLSPAQRADVLAFAQNWRKQGTSGVIIDVPSGRAISMAAADSLREVHSILSASGIPANGVRVRRYTPADPALPSIKLSYTKMVADAGPCGEWPADLGLSGGAADFSNTPYWNLGCASQRNLASMVDDPADLIQPRGESPAYEARRSVALDKYRRGENPSGTYPNYDKGKISDLGK
jgi:pilus assembly protein CpaD